MNRTLIVAPVAIVLAAFAVGTATPVFAADTSCATAPAAIRAAAVNAAPDAQRKALGNAAIGEKLCVAGNDFAAAAKFKVAAKALGVEYAQLTTPAVATK